MPVQGRHIEIRGIVQGVGFRPWVYQLAHRDGIAGRVCNDSRGVLIDAFGPAEALDRFIDALSADSPPAARVRELEWAAIPVEQIDEFTIVPSEPSATKRVTIPPDLATCDNCLGEIFDPSDRRHLYPFTNCTNCGPRYSIVRGIPYDRDKTTMASFEMCDDCRREYEDPLDRRFHAQPNACPMCGPRLTASSPDGREISTYDPLQFAARAIRAQLIVAVKGLGGFHLACDATSSIAVARLRERKHRETKPLAVMARDLEDAERLGIFTDTERNLLTSVERPIVLVRHQPQTTLAPEVTGDNPLIGLFLPYTPLHHILLRECGRPLVMTSGNIAEEPMITRNDEALGQLGDIADLFLLHDREIETRVDDSVVRVIDAQPTLFRRARGYVPRGIEVAKSFAEPVLACGAHLKNTFCIGIGNAAFLGPHIGDLETVDTLRAYEAAIAQMKQFVGVDPKVVAHDLHPQYFSTLYALAQDGVRTIGVQHHHAHIAAVMAEHRLTGPVVGIAYDGTGYGTDNTSWGAEIMIADEAQYRRFATFRAVPLAGGDQAIRQVWRIALALLDEAFEGEPPLHAIPLFRDMPRRGIDAVRSMVARGLNSPLARGAGRYFDAIGAVILGMPDSRYEGEVAFQLNMAADPNERGVYPVVVHDGVSPWEVDLRPVMKAAVEDLMAGRPATTISARFHNTLAAVTSEIARAAIATARGVPVVLGGGCFQNARLAEDIINALRPRTRVYMSHDVPPGDGGLALGQAIVANAVARIAESRAERNSEVEVCV